MNNQTTEPTADTQTSEPKTFTQEDVNRIVQDRLAKERAKTSSELEQKAAELALKEFNMLKDETAKKHNIPREVLDTLKASDAAELEKAVEILNGWGNRPRAYDKDGNEYVPRFVGSTPGPVGGAFKFDKIREAMGLNKKG